MARFMNHSCEPNCETQKWTVFGDIRVGLFAIKDIPEGEEVTFNYNLECIGKEKKPCACGARNCSGFIGMKIKQVCSVPSLTLYSSHVQQSFREKRTNQRKNRGKRGK